LPKVLLVGLGGDAEDEVADLELGGAEEGGVGGDDEQAGDLEEFVLSGAGDGLSELLGLSFLGGGQGFLHGWLSEGVGGFLGESSSC
jgi:hypothetical protein